MNEWLAQMYGTNGANSEELEKQASLELFAKLAAKHNIDLSQLSNAQVNELYAQTFPEFAKTAEDDDDEEEKDEEEKDKKEKAEEYVEEKKAFQEKFAEADLMGRVMAHAFVQEREEIEKSARAISEQEAGEFTKKVMGERAAKGQAASAAREAARYAGPSQAGKGHSGAKQVGEVAGSGRELMSAGKRFLGTRAGKATAAGLGAAALAGGGYAAYKGLKGKEKKSSAEAFEELAANQAIKIASAAGFDADEAFNRVNAVYTLGLQETEKVASVQNLDDALHIRGLEYLESAGYPVDWSEIYGE